MLVQILSCKYIIHVNIITSFNKLQMHLNSKNLITFIIFFSIFKYKVLFFDLTNKLIFYQQYMNKVLFNFLNCFMQIYFDDILIYSKICREHVDYIHSVLRRFQKAGLQVDIQKYKFHI